MLTLKEYINQENPKRGVVVRLTSKEYKFTSEPYEVNGERRINIVINHYSSFYYYLNCNDGFLYTESNKRSCFCLERFDVISPDGFSISSEDIYYSKPEAEKALIKWITNYERQGYYSMSNREKITLKKVKELSNIVNY